MAKGIEAAELLSSTIWRFQTRLWNTFSALWQYARRRPRKLQKILCDGDLCSTGRGSDLAAADFEDTSYFGEESRGGRFNATMS